jgi:hypothetical protein
VLNIIQTLPQYTAAFYSPQAIKKRKTPNPEHAANWLQQYTS